MEQLGEKKQRRVFHQLSLILKLIMQIWDLTSVTATSWVSLRGTSVSEEPVACIFRALGLYF